MIDLNELKGPIGGLLALFYGAGCASGYMFANKQIKNEVKRLELDIKKSDELCEARIKAQSVRYDAEIETLKQVIEDTRSQVIELQKSILNL